MMLFYYLFALLKCIHTIDVICDGSFKFYTPTRQNSHLEYYEQFPSNSSCWFNQNGATIQIKDQIYQIPIGKCADLIKTSPYVLCQNVELTEKYTYEISFQVGNGISINSSTIIAELNGIIIMNFTSFGQYKLTTANKKFISYYNTRTLCFRSTDTRINNSFLSRGPLITKVSMIKLQQKQIQIECKIGRQDLSKIVINCNTSLKLTNLDQLFKKYLQIYIQNEIINPLKIQNEQNNFQIIVNLQKSIRVNNITLKILQPIYYNQEYHKINLIYNNSCTTYIYQKQNQIKMINLLYLITEKLMNITNSAFVALRATLAAYFITNIICFWNLCLLYNLLNITTAPLFLKIFYQQLLYKFFNLSSIINWLNSNIHGFEEKFRFVYVLDRQHMVQNKHGFGWFGYFDISSQFLENNIEQLLTIGILIIKLFALLKIRKIICKELAIILPKKKYIASIFMKQLFVGIIFITLSAFCDILQSGFTKHKEKINGILQHIGLWISLIIYPTFFLIQMSKKKTILRKFSKKKKIQQVQKQGKNNQKKVLDEQIQEQLKRQRKIGKLIIKQCLYNLLDLLFYIVIPSIIIFDSPITFLGVTTLLIWMRCWWFYKFSSKFAYSRRKKIFIVINLLTWFIHHHIYVFFYVLEIIQKYFLIVLDENVFDIIKICGYLSILTILIGGICQIINFILDFFTQIILVMKIIYKKINMKKIVPRKQIENIHNHKISSKNEKGVLIAMRIKKKLNKEKQIKEQKNKDKKYHKDNQMVRQNKNIIEQKQGKLNYYIKAIFHHKKRNDLEEN